MQLALAAPDLLRTDAIAAANPTALRAQTKPAAAAEPFVHPPLGPIPAGAQFNSAGHLDPEAATQAYLDSFPQEKRAASDKYFEGGYWLTLGTPSCRS